LWLDCDEPVYVHHFPWGDDILATDPVPRDSAYFRITAGAEHEGSAPIGNKAVLIGMNVLPSDNDGDDFLPPSLDMVTLARWIGPVAT
jgi:hypothetical protein